MSKQVPNVYAKRPHRGGTPLLCDDFLAKSEEIMQDVKGYLKESEEKQLRRRERLHQRWEEEHFRKHQEHVAWQLAGPRYDVLKQRRSAHANQYLDVTDRKGHVFLDSYSSKDGYDPFALSRQRPHTLKTSPRNWKTDPLQYVATETSRTRNIRTSEIDAAPRSRMMFITHPQKPLKPLGRHGTSWDEWDEVGRTYIDSDARQCSQQKILNIRNTSGDCADSLVDRLPALPST
eukprot:scpid88960/ scgid21368/ UPF0638 protein B